MLRASTALVIPHTDHQNQNNQLLLSTKSLLSLINRDNFDAWLSEQPGISLSHILDNIGGAQDSSITELFKGVVVASPSKVEPNYFYQWTRDAALTIDALNYKLAAVKNSDVHLASVVESYINNTYTVQRISNPSGDFNSLDGLGEPKFYCNDTAFDGAWGRPQNDGPALRSTAIMNYLSLVRQYNNSELILAGADNSNYKSVDDIYQNIIKPDLKYVVKKWQDKGFDLWEEIYGQHFFTSLVQLKALKKSFEVTAWFNEKDQDFLKGIEEAFTGLQQFIKDTYYNDSLQHIYENPAVDYKYGLDIGTIIGSIVAHSDILNQHESDPQHAIPGDVDDPFVLNSFYLFINDQKARYSLNQGSGSIALGRYPNDVYNGHGTSLGNPWFLSNAYAAQFMYRKLNKLYSNQQGFNISKLEYPFYNTYVYNLTQLSSNYNANNEYIFFDYMSDSFKTLVNHAFSFGDSYLKLILQHISDQGELSEQFNRDNGYSEGARNLTWSYTSVINAISERGELLTHLQ